MRRRNPKCSAHEKALALLARREQSCRELRERLLRDGYGRDELDTALRRLGKDGHQSDTRFAEMIVRVRVANGYGPGRIRAELRTHDIDAVQIEQLLDQAEVDWWSLARQQLQRRYDGKAVVEYAERARCAQFLLRRGFDTATVNTVTRAEVGAIGDHED